MYYTANPTTAHVMHMEKLLGQGSVVPGQCVGLSRYNHMGRVEQLGYYILLVYINHPETIHNQHKKQSSHLMFVNPLAHAVLRESPKLKQEHVINKLTHASNQLVCKRKALVWMIKDLA